jgi:hypothetical protein
MKVQTIAVMMALFGAVAVHAMSAHRQARTIPDPAVQLMAGSALVTAGLTKFKRRTSQHK